MTGARATLVGTLAEPDAGMEPADVDVLEVRADLVGELDVDDLRRRFPSRLLYTSRSAAEGGRGPDGRHERTTRLLAAAEKYDLVDLEAERDLHPEILVRVPPERRIVSWHGPPGSHEALGERAVAMTAEPAWLYKLVVEARRPGQGLAPLVMLHTLGRDDVTAFAAGEATSWTRLLAPRLGAPVVYGAVAGQGAAGQPTVERLRRDYGLPDLPPARHLCGLVGHPVAESLSPRLHNGIYRALGLEFLYLAFDVPVFGDYWLDVVESGGLESLGFPLVGLSVTAPFKEVALAVAGAASPLADRIGSANTLIHNGLVWEAEATDPDGVSGPLDARSISVAGRSAVVLGAGGAARAAIFALGRAGAEVRLANRSRERGLRVASELGVPFVDWDDLEPADFEVIVNATPLGSATADRPPVAADAVRPDAVVLDLAYRADRPTELVAKLRERGIVAIDGREALLHQALAQFRLITDVPMPADLGARILGLEPGAESA